MSETTTTLRLKAIDDGMIATLVRVTTTTGNLAIASLALENGFKGLSKASSSSFGQMALGVENANKLTTSITKLASANDIALKSFSTLSDLGVYTEYAAMLTKGLQDAAIAYTRVDQTFALLQRSGVSTKPVEDFYSLTDAIKGSGASLDQFAINSVAQLGRFEQAAARAGTILRSSLDFDASGVAKRATKPEILQNAFQVQNLVNSDLKNSVTSTDALLGQYEVLSSGFTKTAQSQEVLSSGLKLLGIGRAGGVAADASETIKLLTKTMNAYEQSSSEAAKTGAILNSVVENGLTTVPELSLTFGQTAKTAKAAQVQLVDLGAATATLTAQGTNTATALTGLQSVFGSIISKTPEAETALSKLSLNGQKIRFDAAEVQAKGFTKALLDLNQAAGGSPKILQNIFPDELSFRTVVALLAEDGRKLANTRDSVASTSAKSLDEVFETATSDRVSKFQQIVNKFQELIIKVASSVAPVFEPGLEALEKISLAFSSLPDSVKEAIGQFIVFQITTKASFDAVGILLKTLFDLGQTYLTFRAFELVFTGALGGELAVMRDLITQRKGLVAVALQLLGIDQRWQLATEATTASLEKQNIVTKAVVAARSKATEVVEKNVASFTGLPTKEAVTAKTEELIAKGKQAASNVGQSAANVALGVGEATGFIKPVQILGPDGKPLNESGLGRIKAEAAKIGGAVADGLNAGKAKATEAATGAASFTGLIGLDGKALPMAEVATNVKQKTEGVINNIVPQESKLAPSSSTALSDLISKNSQYITVRQKALEVMEKESDLESILLKKNNELIKARERASQLTIESQAATATALAATGDNRQKLIDEAVLKAQKTEVAKASISSIERDIGRTREDLDGVTQQRIKANQAWNDKANELSVKYSEAIKRESLAREYNAQALKFEEQAIIAKAKAAELEKLAVLQPGDIALQSRLKQENALATALETEATKLKTKAQTESLAANQLAIELDRTAILAEKGLAETRIFGVTVAYSTVGPLGAINKLLATEISLKGASAVATNALSAAQIRYAEATVFFKSAVKEAKTLLASEITLKSTLTFVTNALSAAQGGLSAAFNASGVPALLGTLGPLAPLLAVGASAVAVFSEDLFGLRRASDKAAEGLQEILKKDRELGNKYGREKRLLQFKTEITGDTPTAQIETRLANLRLSGDITTSQFNLLRESLAKVGAEGGNAATKLNEFKAQIEAVRQGATGKKEENRSVYSGISDFVGGIPGNTVKLLGFPFWAAGIATAETGKVFSGRFNEVAKSPAEAAQDFDRNREVDQLAKNYDSLDNNNENLGNRSIITQQAINRYKKGYGLNDSTNLKIQKGTKLTADDFDLEKQSFEDIKVRNEAVINELDKNLVEQRKIVEQIKDPGIKADFEQRIKLIEEERLKLEKRNEVIKLGAEEFKKYYSETLPGLRRAIVDTTNLSGALGNTQTQFENQFKLDDKGRPTPYIKDITTLRNEASQFQTSIQEAYQGGLFEKTSLDPNGKYSPTGPYLPVPESQKNSEGASTAASLLRETRDNKIKLANGTTGYRLAVNDRIQLTQQIVEYEQAASKAKEAYLKIDADKVKENQAERLESEEEAAKKTAQIQIKTIQQTLAQKEIEVQENSKFPVRKAQLEREFAALQIQLETAIGAEQTRLLLKRREQRQELFNIEIESTKALQAGRKLSVEQSEKDIAQLQILQTKDRLKNLEEDYERSGKKSIDQAQKIAMTRAQLNQMEAAEETRLLIKRREQRQEAFNIEIENTKALQASRKIGLLQSEKEIAQFQIAQSKARLNTLIEDDNRAGRTSIDQAQKIALAKAQLRQLEANEVERLFNVEQERQKRALSNLTQIRSLPLQQQTNVLDIKSKDIDLVGQLSGSISQLKTTLIEAQTSSFQLQLKVTGDIEKRAGIETQIAVNRLKSLEVTQRQEQVSLEISTRTNEITLQREAIQIRLGKLDNERQIGEANLELIKARREKRTPEEIQNLELQIKNLQQQGNLLDARGKQNDQAIVQQREITQNSRQELTIKQATARAEAAIELTLARRREIQARIESLSKDVEVRAQSINVAGQVLISRSEAVTKQYEIQKTLLDSAQTVLKSRSDYISGELSIASNLATTDQDRQEIAKVTAAIKLRTLDQQLLMEQKVLELNQAQATAQLQQEKIRNQISQSQSLAGIATEQAKVAAVEADPTSSPQAKAAARLGLQAKVEEYVSLGYEGNLLNQKGEVQSQIQGTERQNFRERSGLQRDQGLVEFAQATGRDDVLELLQRRALGKAMGISPDTMLGSPGSFGDAFVKTTEAKYFDKPGEPTAISGIEAEKSRLVNQYLNLRGNIPLQLDFPDYEKYRREQIAKLAEFGYQPPFGNQTPENVVKQTQDDLSQAVKDLIALVNQKLGTPNQITINSTSNYAVGSSEEAKKAAEDLDQKLNQKLYDVGLKLMSR